MEALESIIKSIKRSPDANFLTTAGLITLIGFDAPPGGLLLTFLGVKQYISGFDGYKIASKYIKSCQKKNLEPNFNRVSKLVGFCEKLGYKYAVKEYYNNKA